MASSCYIVSCLLPSSSQCFQNVPGMAGGRVSSLPPPLESGIGEDGMAEEGDSRGQRGAFEVRAAEEGGGLPGHHGWAP